MHSKVALAFLLLLPFSIFAQDTAKKSKSIQWKVEYDIDDLHADTLEYEISFRLKITPGVYLLKEPEITFDQGLVIHQGLRASSTELIFDKTLQILKESKITEVSGTITCATGGSSYAEIPEVFKIKLKEKPKE